MVAAEYNSNSRDRSIRQGRSSRPNELRQGCKGQVGRARQQSWKRGTVETDGPSKVQGSSGSSSRQAVADAIVAGCKSQVG